MTCACGEWDDWQPDVQTIASWSDYHHHLNGHWHALERDLSRTCSRWLLQDVKRNWFAKQLAELSPEVISLLNRASEMN